MNPSQTATRNKIQLLAASLAVVLAFAGGMFIRQAPSDPVGGARQTEMPQGVLDATGSCLDVGIQGPGYLAVRRSDRAGGLGYTRYGLLLVNKAGELVVGVGRGLPIEPNVKISADATFVTIEEDGTVRIKRLGSNAMLVAGHIRLVRFDHPRALAALGDGVFAATTDSGNGIARTPGQYGTGRLLNGFLEELPAAGSPRS